MTPLQPYEQIINDKLNSLPLPNMADAIWADIEAQLDIDLPSNDDPAPSNPPTGGGWVTGIKLGAVVAGIVVLAYLFTQLNKRSTIAPPQPAKPTEKTIPTRDTVQQTKTVAPLMAPPNNNQPTIGSPTINAPAPLSKAAQLPSMIDSLQLQPINIPPLKKDTGTITPPILSPVLLPNPGKKQRGTQGIQDSDYKFVRDKDTT